MAATAGTDAQKEAKPGGCLTLAVHAFVAFLLLGLLFGAVAAVVMGAGALPGAAGLTGTAGRVTLSSCETRNLNSRTKETTCTGSFVSADGRVRDPRARVGGVKPGEAVDVRKTGGHSYERTGPAAVDSGVTETLFGVFMLHVFTLGSLTALREKRKRAAPSWRSLGWSAGALGLAVLARFVIHLAG